MCNYLETSRPVYSSGMELDRELITHCPTLTFNGLLHIQELDREVFPKVNLHIQQC